MSLHPELLDGVHLEATEKWLSDGSDTPEIERDAVHFYRSVPIEVQQTENQRPLSVNDLAQQQRLARDLEGLIDRATGGHTALLGHLFNLDGHIWTLDEFQALYQWTGEQGPLVAGRPTILLHFTPAPGVHPGSRMAKVLSHTAGVIEADAETGQVLSGSFHSLAPVKFGAGLLANLSYFDGTFTMQPVTTAEGECWVMRQAVVKVRARELFRHRNGTETITYAVSGERGEP
jgi:hypothetical protein